MSDDILGRLATLTGRGLTDEESLGELVKAEAEVKTRRNSRENNKKIHSLDVRIDTLEDRIEELQSRGDDATDLIREKESNERKVGLLRKASRGSGELDMTEDEIREAEKLTLSRNVTNTYDLLRGLNIDVAVQLSKKDTRTLLASLLTCSERQLASVLDHPDVPIVIKTVIKRLLADMGEGRMDTVERLWDRIFGKAGMESSAGEKGSTGIIPDAPVSREGYELIYERVVGRKYGEK